MRTILSGNKWRLAALTLAMSGSVIAWAEEPKPTETTKTEEPKKQEPEVKQTPIDGLKEVVTDSGLKYWDIKVGEGASPAGLNTTVTIHYTGWFTDGKLFDSTVTSGQPATYPLNIFIKGWAEGVSSMKKGGKRRLEIPPKIAYGERGKPPKIPPNSTLIFEIELIDFKDPPPPPQQTSIEGLKEEKTKAGVSYWDIKVGDGAVPSSPSAKVTVHYTGWLKSDGTMFDSSVTKGQPYTLPLNRFIEGWWEGVGSMKVGGKRRLEIPAALAYKERGYPPLIGPNADLIFEVELIKAE